MSVMGVLGEVSSVSGYRDTVFLLESFSYYGAYLLNVLSSPNPKGPWKFPYISAQLGAPSALALQLQG